MTRATRRRSPAAGPYVTADRLPRRGRPGIVPVAGGRYRVVVAAGSAASR